MAQGEYIYNYSGNANNLGYWDVRNLCDSIYRNVVGTPSWYNSVGVGTAITASQWQELKDKTTTIYNYTVPVGCGGYYTVY